MRFREGKPFNRVPAVVDLHECFSSLVEASNTPENLRCFGPEAELFVPNNAWNKFVPTRRGQFRKLAASRVKALAYAAQRGDDPEFDPDPPFTEEEEEEFWDLVMEDFGDKLHGDSFVPPPPLNRYYVLEGRPKRHMRHDLLFVNKYQNMS